MPLYTDQTGRKVEITTRPQRIVSLVPSQTELLYHLGLDEQVVGITSFCIHPSGWYQSKKRIGGTKSLHLDWIESLQPDLIIANKEENEKTQVEALAENHPVWLSDVSNLDDALQMIASIGRMTNRQDNAAGMIADIQHRFKNLQATNKKIRSCYLIWQQPYMTVGGDTFINDMLSRAGFANVFGGQKRYPAISIDAIRQQQCELVLLSSEPYPFKQTHVELIQQELPGTDIRLVEGEMFSWYGSRLLESPAYFQQLRQAFS